MIVRVFWCGTLAVALLGALHGCASDGSTPGEHAAGTTNGAGRHGTTPSGSSGANTGAGGSRDEAGAPNGGGTLGNGDANEAASGGRGGTGRSRSSSGGTRSSTSRAHPSTGGTRSETGGAPNGISGIERAVGGEAGAEAGDSSSGGAGNDSMAGSAGNHSVAGSAGTNAVAGGAGTNSAMGGASTGSAGTTSVAGAPSNGGGGIGGQANSGGSAGQGGTPCIDTLNLPLLTSAPATLDLTGLYTSPASDPTNPAPYVDEYTPRYPLWSDGANKKRWIYLPACTQIDTSNMDHWVFPIGTRFWKEFRIGDTLVETRFIHRFGPGDADWLFAAYQWDPSVPSPTAGNTIYVPHGVGNANGTPHDIPDQSDCGLCHEHLPEHVLGFSAFELTGSPGALDINVLSQEHLLTIPAPDGFIPPGTSTQQAGLGYLHANCGICHNAFFSATPTSPPQMRLLVTQTTLEATDTFTTMVNVPTQNPEFLGIPRIKPGDHTNSEVYMRMSARGDDRQMPPVATETVDPDGLAAVAAFIDSLDP